MPGGKRNFSSHREAHEGTLTVKTYAHTDTLSHILTITQRYTLTDYCILRHEQKHELGKSNKSNMMYIGALCIRKTICDFKYD